MSAPGPLVPTLPGPPGHRHLPAAVACLFLLVAAAAAAVFEHGVLPGAESRPWEPWAVLVLVGLPGLLLAAALERQARERARAHADAARLTAELDQLALVARLTSNAVVIADAAGLITWVNAGFERITGYSAVEAIGRSPGSLLHCPQTDQATIARVRSALRAGQPCSGEILNRAKDGRLYWIQIDIQPRHDAGGRLSGFMAIETDITAAKCNEAALHRSQALLRNTGRIAGVGGWTYDMHSEAVHWSDQTCRILEVEPGFQPTLQYCLDRCPGPARTVVRQAMEQGFGQDLSWDFELPLVTARGRAIWVRVMAEAEILDGGLVHIVGALQDITAQRALRGEAQRSVQVLQGAIEALDEGFVLFGPDDRLVFCNDKYREIYATSADLIVPGARFEHLIRQGAERGQYMAAVGRVDEWVVERMAAHRSGDTNLVQRIDNGRVLRILERCTADGHVVGFRIDVTELVHAKEAAEVASRAKSEFISTISHELRTPLQSIIGFSEMGAQFALDEAHPRFEALFREVHAGGHRMLTLVNALLDLSKMELGRDALQRKPCDLAALAREVMAELRPQAAERRLRLQLPDTLPPLPALADPYRLQQVLRNLLSNALRFAPAGSPVELDGQVCEGQAVEMSVRDHGPGIPPDELETIFEPFEQSSRTRDGSGGTGLGLTISRRIMAAHGGTLQAFNAPGGGAILRMRLPCDPPPTANGP